MAQNSGDTAFITKDIRRVKLHEDIDLGQTGQEKNFNTRIDSLQQWLEKEDQFDHRLKIKYLSGIKSLLDDLQNGRVPSKDSHQLLDAYRILLEADIKEQSIAEAIKNNSLAINRSLLGERTAFYENAGLAQARVFMYYQFIRERPDQILPTISNYLNESFVAEALITAAQKYPSDFYNYASAMESPLRKSMLMVDDAMVQLLCRLSADSSGRLLYPFIHAIITKETSYDSLKQVSKDAKKFFSLLVATQIHYQSDLQSGNPPIEYGEIFKLLEKKAVEIFINEINALHDEPDAVRFKIIEGLTPEELYYLMVASEDIIYTSSFVGIFQKMMSSMNKRKSDELLISIHFDRFRKFIKMAADYNKLDDFVNAMRPDQAKRLMKDFVAGLEKDMTLETAVDVVNGYSSISNASLKTAILKEVEANILSLKFNLDSEGVALYETIQLLLKSDADSGKSFSKQFALDPPYFLMRDKLLSNGRIVEQLFFYGDKDGKLSFENFLTYYTKSKFWKIYRAEKWIEIKSLQGKPISVFANNPFDHADGEDRDTEAQTALSMYLQEQQWEPSIVVHRGHSYHLPSTISQLPLSAKVVLLGSCGSYQHLSKVLDVCPDAQIISSREVGSLSVNDPILRTINEAIRTGQNLDWVGIWKHLQQQMRINNAKQRFENYVAPHKNLGLMLLKARGKNR
ncbi:MAG: hypothetical protein FJX88_05155 [Bacteroidetes bacterium]|nr:hypothetical protein [Bacteroidota bacterium]